MSKIKGWTKVGDYVWKNNITKMEVGIEETDIGRAIMYEIYGKMPNRLAFELYGASGGDTFTNKSVAIDALMCWMRENLYG